MRRFFKRKIVWIPLAVVLLLIVLISFFRGEDTSSDLSLGSMLSAAEHGQLERVEVQEHRLKVRLRGDRKERWVYVGTTEVLPLLQASGVSFDATDSGATEIVISKPAMDFLFLPLYVVGWVIFGVVVHFAVLFAIRRAHKDPQQPPSGDHSTQPTA